MKKKILYITQSFPFPPSSGTHIKTLSTLTVLASKFDVYLFCMTSKHPSAHQIEQIKKITPRFSFFICPKIDYRFRSHPIWTFCSYLQSKPYLFFQYYHPKVNLKVREIIKHFNPHVIHCDHFSMAQFLPKEKTHYWVLESHNVESKISLGYAKYSPNIFRRLLYLYETVLIKKQEKKLFPRFDRIFVLSINEKNNIKKEAPNTIVTLQKLNFHRFPVYVKNESKLTKNNYLLFLGDFDWFPNMDGIRWFITKIFPLMSRKMKNLELHIVGNKSENIFNGKTIPKQIFIHGHQKDLKEFFSNATVFIVPIRIASGIRFKVLTAFRNRVPVVSTTEGEKGINGVSGCCLTSNNANAFAQQTFRLLGSLNLRNSLTKKAITYLKKNFCPSSDKDFLREYEMLLYEPMKRC